MASDAKGDSVKPRAEIIATAKVAINSQSKHLSVGSIVVPSYDIPSLGIWKSQSYELQAIFDQGSQDGTTIEKVQVSSLSEPSARAGYTRYITLHSSRYHKEPVIITPGEVGLVSMRNEVINSVLVALPILGFWTTVAISFVNSYTDRYGGTFLDALFRT